jgi:hypothetical protein
MHRFLTEARVRASKNHAVAAHAAIGRVQRMPCAASLDFIHLALFSRRINH